MWISPGVHSAPPRVRRATREADAALRGTALEHREVERYPLVMIETSGGRRVLDRSDVLLLGGTAAAVLVTGVAHFGGLPSVLTFVCSALAVAGLAALVGRSVEQFGDRFGAGATGVLQSGLGNLPELFIGIFALRAGLVQVVQAAIIGSILSNALLVLGLAFIVGGLRHGEQRFDSQRARTICALLVLTVAAMVLPGVAAFAHTPAEGHERTLSIVVAVVLLAVFVLSLPASLQRGEGEASTTEPPRWPLGLAVGVLAGSSVVSALVSDWFVAALTPAMNALHVSQVFAGLVVVAIAGNAIENFVGIQLAARNQADYAFAVIVNSPLQIALVLAPALVLLSGLLGGAPLTLVFSPLLMASVALTVVAVSFIIFDGRSNWLEGVALVGVYGVIATTFWWG
jgi:Ca2+:H+ antiporter